MDTGTWLVVVIGTACGVLGTGLGALLAFLIGAKSSRFVSVVMEFAAGVMTAVVCFDLLPHALAMASLPVALGGFLTGVAMAMLLQDAIKFRRPQGRGGRLEKTGFVVMAAVALHNFPEGLAVGAGLEASLSLGITIAAAIALHDIPEGMAMALPLRISGYSKWRTVLMTAATGLPMGLGALLGAVAGGVSTVAVGACLACAAGAMLYIVSGDLLSESKVLYRGRLPAVGNMAGFLAGMAVSFVF